MAQDTVAQDTGIPVQAEQEMEQEVGTRQTNGFTVSPAIILFEMKCPPVGLKILLLATN